MRKFLLFIQKGQANIRFLKTSEDNEHRSTHIVLQTAFAKFTPHIMYF